MKQTNEQENPHHHPPRLRRNGRADFLRDHKRFQEDITNAVEILEKML